MEGQSQVQVQDFKQDIRICHGSAGNARWPEIFGQSWLIPSWALLLMRSTMAIVFSTTLVFDGLTSKDGWRFFIYLTRWSFILESLYFCLAAWVTFQARRITSKRSFNEPQISSSDSRLPRSVQAMSLLWTLTFPISVLVCMAFWTLINPIWDMKMHPNFVLVTEHFLNMLMFIVEFVLNRNIFYLKHGMIIYIYALLYILWSLIHFVAKIGVAPAMACKTYPLEECPIYPVLDWHHPGRTLVVFLGVTFATVVLQMLIWTCTRKRDQRFTIRSGSLTVDRDSEI
eukprot:symbB.v1.2.007201.t1/scaffold439.1/size205343/4